MSDRGGLCVPPRPYLPPVLVGAGAGCVAAATVMECGWRAWCDVDGGVHQVGAAASLFAALGVLAVLVSCAAGRRCGRGTSACVAWRRYVCWIGVGLLLGGASGVMGVHSRERAVHRLDQAPASSFVFEIVGDPSMSDFGARHTAHVLDESGGEVATVSLSSDAMLESGSRVRLVGRISELDEDEWDKGRYMSGEVADVRAVHILAQEEGHRDPIMMLRASLIEVIDPAASDARALLAGIVCGRTTELDASEVTDAFARTGTSHLIAVSGGHLALLASLAQFALARLHAGPRERTVLLSLLMGSYVVFTGGAPSAVRSFYMVVSMLVAGITGRRGHGLSALGLTIMLLVVTDAGIVYDLGFQLSAASVLFIHLFSSYLAYTIRKIGVPDGAAEALALTLCAQWATLPITIPVFGECSLVAPVANLVLAPVMSALLVVGLVVIPLVRLVPVLHATIALPDALASVSIFGAKVCAGIPYASIAVEESAMWLLAYLVAAVVYLSWWDIRRRHLLVGLAAVGLTLGSFTVFWWRFAPPCVTVLDVGQADAILVRDGCSALLVDTGVDDEVVQALARNHVLRLDAVLITHWDRDHCGGLGDVLEAVPVSRIIVARGALAGMPADVADLPLPPIVEIERGDKIEVGYFSCEAVWPFETVAGTENSESLVLAVHYEEQGKHLDALLTGDTEVSQEQMYAAAVGDIDLLKLGHHGSAASVDDKVLAILDPELAVASAGEGNSYGHPAPECVDAVERSGARFLCTMDAGDVAVEPGEQGVSVLLGRSASTAGSAIPVPVNVAPWCFAGLRSGRVQYRVGTRRRVR